MLTVKTMLTFEQYKSCRLKVHS